MGAPLREKGGAPGQLQGTHQRPQRGGVHPGKVEESSETCPEAQIPGLTFCLYGSLHRVNFEDEVKERQMEDALAKSRAGAPGDVPERQFAKLLPKLPAYLRTLLIQHG